ncbi:hypothetical protein SAMN02990966_06928 [Rhodospirillales bacterium URHD0017]|nr:hypothetical protein SAMN02990966_06928 [Rhodospirillales bacterium URHD0017]
MSIRAYSATRGADRTTIRRKIAEGVIQLDSDGLIDEQQADSAWAITRRASRMGVDQNGDAGIRSAQAKVAVTLAKLRLTKQRYQAMRERYVDRAEAVAVGEQEAIYVVEGLRNAPAAYAPTLAQEMGIPEETARRILDRFIGLTLIEIGDLPRAAKRDAERA